MTTVAILGLGGRGRNYGNKLNHASGEIKITAICDKVEAKRTTLGNSWGVAENMRFADSEQLFEKGKLADCLIIATQDRDHYGHAMRALDLGYNLLLEKPVSPVYEECLDIERSAREKGLYVVVCHVLRYSPYYKKIKEIITTGLIGDVIQIKHSENISFWHFSHSYVRGNWHSEAQSAPMLLAKCCHDMDLLYWFCDSKCKKLSSYGGLKLFVPSRKPEGATERCFDCPHQNTCAFDAEFNYLGRKRLIGRTRPKFLWGTYAFSTEKNRKGILADLKKSNYSKCVFNGENDVMDYQSVVMEMENGINCVFTVNALNEHNYRRTVICGTKGEIIANDRTSILTLYVFGKKPQRIQCAPLPVISGHAGGDKGLVDTFVNIANGTIKDVEHYSLISETLESHRIVAGAEYSRLNGNVTVDMTTFKK